MSAISTHQPEEGSIIIAGAAGMIGLVAPAALQAAYAEGRPVRLRVRIRPPSVPGGGGAAVKSGTTAGSAQGMIVISSQPLRPQAIRSAGDGGHKV